MPQKTNNRQSGFTAVEVVIVVVVALALAIGGWYVWQQNQDDKAKDSVATTPEGGNEENQSPGTSNETASWVSVTTQGKAFSMKVPDGWKIVNYPADFLGSVEVIYKPGTPATVEVSSTEYFGHELRFRASVVAVDDAGLGPQWSSPQPGLTESTEDFSIGSLQGKRYKAVFSEDLSQTLYEYVFDVGNNKKLDIVYTIYEGEKDDVATVERAIKTIQLKQ